MSCLLVYFVHRVKYLADLHKTRRLNVLFILLSVPQETEKENAPEKTIKELKEDVNVKVSTTL